MTSPDYLPDLSRLLAWPPPTTYMTWKDYSCDTKALAMGLQGSCSVLRGILPVLSQWQRTDRSLKKRTVWVAGETQCGTKIRRIKQKWCGWTLCWTYCNYIKHECGYYDVHLCGEGVHLTVWVHGTKHRPLRQTGMYVTCSNEMSRMSVKMILRKHCINIALWFSMILTLCHQSIL